MRFLEAKEIKEKEKSGKEEKKYNWEKQNTDQTFVRRFYVSQVNYSGKKLDRFFELSLQNQSDLQKSEIVRKESFGAPLSGITNWRNLILANADIWLFCFKKMFLICT